MRYVAGLQSAVRQRTFVKRGDRSLHSGGSRDGGGREDRQKRNRLARADSRTRIREGQLRNQYASANGLKDHAILLDCKKIEHEYVPFDLGEYALVIANCNKPHNLVESKYNERRRETEDALEIFKTVLPVECLAEVTVEEFEKYKGLLSGKIADRAKHVVYERERVNEAVAAMRSGDVVTLGRLLNESPESLKTLYEVTGRELDVLAETAQSFDGCLGSRMTGAGFGGCTISVVEKGETEEFKKYVGDKYLAEIGYAASFYDAEIDDGITVVKL